MGKNNWHISDFINCIKEEVDARENCDFMKDKNDYEHLRNTTHSLLGIQKHSRKNCVFCGKLHYSDKCQNVIDVSIRKKILRNEKRRFRCLMTGHILKNCRTSYKCYSCRGKNHHTSICENTTNIDDKNDSIDGNKEDEEKVAMLIDAKTDVLLQTADCIISNPRETKTLKIKVLLDPGSQKTHLPDAVKEYLKLQSVTKYYGNFKNYV